MNSPSNVSSCQGITPPLEIEGKSKGAVSTKKSLEGMARGRSVSPATGNALLMVAFTRQNASIAGVVRHAPLLGRESVRNATSGLVLGMFVSRAGNEKMQLQRELEIIDKLENLGVCQKEKTANKHQDKTGFMAVVNGLRSFFTEVPDLFGQRKKDVNERKIREMRATINESIKLGNDGSLEESDEKLRVVFEGVECLGKYNDPSVVSNLCRSKAHILYLRKNVEDALIFFDKSKQFSNFINFPDRLFVLNILAGIGAYKRVFCPEIFYENIKEWLVDDEDNQRRLVEYEKELPGLTVFRDGIKAVFEEEGADTEETRRLAAKKFKQSITKLDKLAEDKVLSIGLIHSCLILKFARNLSLIKQSRFQDALASAQENGASQFNHLGIYIHCQALEKVGSIDRAIEMCEQAVRKGHPLSNYLEKLKLSKVAAEFSVVAY